MDRYINKINEAKMDEIEDRWLLLWPINWIVYTDQIYRYYQCTINQG